MKTKKKKIKEGEDVIERASLLISGRRIWPEGEQRWRCFTDRAGVDSPYTITPDGCNCYAGVNSRHEKLCKHSWACRAPMIVAFILDIRAALDENELNDIAAAFSEEIKKVDSYFVAKARIEYKRKLQECRRMAA